MNYKLSITWLVPFLFVINLFSLSAQTGETGIPLRNLVGIEGIRDNQLSGFGLVTGLSGKGDSPDSPVLKRVLTNFFSKYQLNISEEDLESKNCAVVLISAEIPPFVSSGERLPAYVSSLGDAKSIEGGILLQSPLYGADNVMYAVAQGIVEDTESSPNRTVALLSRGALVEKQIPSSYFNNDVLTLSLKHPGFSEAFSILEGLRSELGNWSVRIRDAGSITLQPPENYEGEISEIIRQIESIRITPVRSNRIVVNSRTGVVVVGGDVGIGTVGVSYKGAKIEVNRDILAADKEVESFLIEETTRVEDLIQLLQELGIDSRGIIEILIAIDRAGALYGELIIM